MPVQAIYSSMKVFVEQQHYFFETLWNRAIPADQKIREIEEGIVPVFIETFDDPKEIENLEMRIVNSSEEEILIIFPTANTFHRHACSGIIKLLLFKKDGMVEIKEEQAIANMISFPSQRSSNLKIRIMTPTDFMIDDTILKLIEKYQENIEIQFIQHSSENTASILVVDKKLSLSVEIKDETQQISNDLAIGLATYSNSKSTVLSYASMFESFWREAEIYEKLKESRIQLNDAKTEIDNMKEYLNEVLEELHGKQ
jgi:hypothetical protein